MIVLNVEAVMEPEGRLSDVAIRLMLFLRRLSDKSSFKQKRNLNLWTGKRSERNRPSQLCLMEKIRPIQLKYLRTSTTIRLETTLELLVQGPLKPLMI